MAREKRQEVPASISVREYARRRKVRHAAVQKAIESGRLAKSVNRDAKGKVVGVFPEHADVEWEANTDQGRAPTPLASGSGFQKARERREVALADKAEMDLRQKRGELVEASEVKQHLVGAFARCRTKLLGIPARARLQLPHLSAADVAIIDGLIREALEDLAMNKEAHDGS